MAIIVVIVVTSSLVARGILVPDKLLLRAIAAFIVLPGTIAFLVPLLLAPSTADRQTWQWSGLVLVAVGAFLLVWCVGDFYVSGRGTLAPWSPPRKLVTAGLYRWSRNPMYVAVGVVLAGWAVWYGSPVLVGYALIVVAAFHLRVLLYEEPRLTSAFGEEWATYKQRVRRWL